MRTAYLIESIECALDGANIPDALTPEQISDLAASLEISLENEGLATGRDSIPNPMEAQLRGVKQAHAENVSWIERGHAERIKELEWTIQRLRSRIHDLEREKA
jgi:hypothetical protein